MLNKYRFKRGNNQPIFRPGAWGWEEVMTPDCSQLRCTFRVNRSPELLPNPATAKNGSQSSMQPFMVYHHPHIALHAHGKPLGVLPRLRRRKPTSAQQDARLRPAGGQTTAERGAERAASPGRGPLSPGLHGGGGTGGHVWQRLWGGPRTPAPRLGSSEGGRCVQGRAVRRGAVHHPFQPHGLWNSTLGELSHTFLLKHIRNRPLSCFILLCEFLMQKNIYIS